MSRVDDSRVDTCRIGEQAVGAGERGDPAQILALHVQPADRTSRRQAHGRLPVGSWLMSRMLRIGFSRVRSRMGRPASSILRTRSVEPTLSKVVVSLMLLSPTMTCSLRNRSASACGSSRVLMIGRLLVVALLTDSHVLCAD